MKRRYYEILGLPDNAPLSDVRKNYRKLVMLYHPDKNQAPDAERRFIEIKEAYEIITGKKVAPATPLPQQRQSRSKKANSTESEATKRARAKEAKMRFEEQRIREFMENELYFRKLTQGFRWKIMTISAITGVFLSLFLTLDLILPHHYEPDEVVAFNANTAYGIGGKRISLIDTEENGLFWIEHFNSRLYHGSHAIFIESSWLFHNPIRIQKCDKVRTFGFPVNFNIYRLSIVLIPLFLFPAFTFWYKRRKISFTVLYQFCMYVVNAVMLFILLSGDRWAHILSFGFL